MKHKNDSELNRTDEPYARRSGLYVIRPAGKDRLALELRNSCTSYRRTFSHDSAKKFAADLIESVERYKEKQRGEPEIYVHKQNSHAIFDSEWLLSPISVEFLGTEARYSHRFKIEELVELADDLTAAAAGSTE